jgi:hypothetical protein
VSSWLLGLSLVACFLAGCAFGLAAVYLYARHVFRSKLGQLSGQLTGARPVPPARPGSGCGQRWPVE